MFSALTKIRFGSQYNFFKYFHVSSVNAGNRWFPDEDFIKDFHHSVMYPTEETEKYYKRFYNGKCPPVERKIRNMWINFGPQHPAAHGVLRLILELEGEIVKRSDTHLGFLHRATEKLMEGKHYNQSLPYMDRLDYVATVNNEQTFSLAVEKLLNVKVPPRAQAIRVLMAELGRVANHLLNVSGVILDCGGITPFFWMCEEREKLYELFERACGARVHCAYIRPGGVSQDLPIGYLDDVYEVMSKMAERIDETEDMSTTNRLLYQRMAGIGAISAHDAFSFGLTGPMLRATGVKYDIRINDPYDGYDLYEFDCVVGTFGDTYDRHLLRLQEMRESIKIINQVIDTIPQGEVRTDDSKCTFPKREEMKTSMESLIHHFKLCTEGYPVPPGVTYTATENPKGEFGLYVVADGSPRPYRLGVRPSSYTSVLALNVINPGLMLADVTVMVASIDVVFGDVDR